MISPVGKITGFPCQKCGTSLVQTPTARLYCPRCEQLRIMDEAMQQFHSGLNSGQPMSKHTSEASDQLQQLWDHRSDWQAEYSYNMPHAADWELDDIYDQHYPEKARERERLEREEGYE